MFVIWTSCFSSSVSRVMECSDSNRMTTQNIGIVFGPTLMRPENEGGNMAINMVYQNQAIELLLSKSKQIFAPEPTGSSWTSVQWTTWPDLTEPGHTQTCAVHCTDTQHGWTHECHHSTETCTWKDPTWKNTVVLTIVNHSKLCLSVIYYSNYHTLFTAFCSVYYSKLISYSKYCSILLILRLEITLEIRTFYYRKHLRTVFFLTTFHPQPQEKMWYILH